MLSSFLTGQWVALQEKRGCTLHNWGKGAQDSSTASGLICAVRGGGARKFITFPVRTHSNIISVTAESKLNSPFSSANSGLMCTTSCCGHSSCHPPGNGMGVWRTRGREKKGSSFPPQGNRSTRPPVMWTGCTRGFTSRQWAARWPAESLRRQLSHWEMLWRLLGSWQA